nr:PucR family transcriptional regulator [uncultured Aminipila sp.]
MNYTVSDFYYTFKQGLKIVAGSGGMARTINSAGILDYEMDSVLKDKYLHSNFHENQLVVTTFLCAKDNPFTISDAVKHLIAKGTSGLVIKNVFKIPIHESVFRYADSKNFPIIFIESQEIYIERIIYEIQRHCELLSDVRFAQQALDQILSTDLSDNEISACIRRINPSCKEQFFNLYIKFDDYLGCKAFDTYYARFSSSNLNVPGNALILNKDGFFFTYSEECITKRFSDKFIQYILAILLENDSYLCCGVSACHLNLAEYKIGLQECLYAASAENCQTINYIKYGDLGTYRLIFPFSQTPEMKQFAKDLLEPLEDYDIENRGHLIPTLCKYIDLDCDIVATSQALDQHKNTVRYRLDKIKEITSLDYKSFSQLEQLSMAVKIYRCKKNIS